MGSMRDGRANVTTSTSWARRFGRAAALVALSCAAGVALVGSGIWEPRGRARRLDADEEAEQAELLELDRRARRALQIAQLELDRASGAIAFQLQPQALKPAPTPMPASPPPTPLSQDYTEPCASPSLPRVIEAAVAAHAEHAMSTSAAHRLFTSDMRLKRRLTPGD